jgi:hypothetical protein
MNTSQVTKTLNTCSSEALSHVFREKRNRGAVFTVRSKKTGKDYSYKIARKEYLGKWYTYIFVEMGYLNFVYLGTYLQGAIWKWGKKLETPAVVAIAWCLKQVENKKFKEMDEQVETFHMGACLVCGRPLTDAVSLTYGVGPVCRGIQ